MESKILPKKRDAGGTWIIAKARARDSLNFIRRLALADFSYQCWKIIGSILKPCFRIGLFYDFPALWVSGVEISAVASCRYRRAATTIWK